MRWDGFLVSPRGIRVCVYVYMYVCVCTLCVCVSVRLSSKSHGLPAYLAMSAPWDLLSVGLYSLGSWGAAVVLLVIIGC